MHLNYGQKRNKMKTKLLKTFKNFLHYAENFLKLWPGMFARVLLRLQLMLSR